MRLAAVLVAVVSAGCLAASSSSGHDSRRVRELEVAFRSGNVTLAGTLFVPKVDGPHPGVVLFHGSGPQSRDSFTGRWFAEQGVAALAYDKRGVGKSSGDFRTVPFTDLVDDGLAGLAFLKARSDIDPKHIGVWGLSQGGWLGPLAASRSKDVAFVIAFSGPGVSPGEQMIFYDGNLLRDGGCRTATSRKPTTCGGKSGISFRRATAMTPRGPRSIGRSLARGSTPSTSKPEDSSALPRATC